MITQYVYISNNEVQEVRSVAHAEHDFDEMREVSTENGIMSAKLVDGVLELDEVLPNKEN